MTILHNWWEHHSINTFPSIIINCSIKMKLNHIKAKLFWSLPGPREGGGAMSPSRISIFLNRLRWNLAQMLNRSWSKRWYHQNFLRSPCEDAIPQNVTKNEKIWWKRYSMLWQRLIFEAVVLKFQVLTILICYILYLWWLKKTFHTLNRHIYGN